MQLKYLCCRVPSYRRDLYTRIYFPKKKLQYWLALRTAGIMPLDMPREIPHYENALKAKLRLGKNALRDTVAPIRPYIAIKLKSMAIEKAKKKHVYSNAHSEVKCCQSEGWRGAFVDR